MNKVDAYKNSLLSLATIGHFMDISHEGVELTDENIRDAGNVHFHLAQAVFFLRRLYEIKDEEPKDGINLHLDTGQEQTKELKAKRKRKP